MARSADLQIEAKSIPYFQIGIKNKTRFGALRFISGIEYTSDEEKLGGISGIRVLDGGNRFLAVSDEGFWFGGNISRDEFGKIIGIAQAKLKTMRNTKGKKITSKHKGDAEGIEIFGDKVLVSFERKSRVYRYNLDLQKLKPTAKNFRREIRKIQLPYNKGLEAITILEQPGTVSLANARIAVFSENALDAKGNIRGFVSAGKNWSEFTVKTMGEFKITDATLLPNDDLLILERQFSISTGPVIRIRRLESSKIVGGALLDGEVIFEADIRHQIDNFEGMSAWVNGKGKTILTMVSDNNFSFLQRNLMLEFELVEPN